MTSTERVVLRAKCSTGKHTIGTVVATPHGYRVDYLAAVRVSLEAGRDAHEARSTSWTEADGNVGTRAYCTGCGKVHRLSPDDLAAAARRGLRHLTLQAEGAYTDTPGFWRRRLRRNSV